MSPGLRKLALTVHVTASVGLLGAIAAFLALSVAGLAGRDPQMVRAAYPAMALIARLVVTPLALAALATGLIQSLGTAWGLFRHYWVLIKLLMTLFATAVLLVKLDLIDQAARLASETILARADLRVVGIQLLVHAAGGLLVLLVPAVLSIYKPQGLTRYGARRQHAL
uniref:Putative integral membrane protein n=1 Tax=Caulobacter sp. (strain K31) TaxID=366602 RepID=B0SUW3_CAUSK